MSANTGKTASFDTRSAHQFNGIIRQKDLRVGRVKLVREIIIAIRFALLIGYVADLSLKSHFIPPKVKGVSYGVNRNK